HLHHAPSSPLFPYTTLFRSLLDQASSDAAPQSQLSWQQMATELFLDRVTIIRAPHSQASACAGLRPKRHARQSTNVLPSCSFKRSEEHTSELQSRVDLVCRL